jgi:hypothetical protein
MGLVLVDSCGSSLNFTIAVLLRRCMVGESKGEQKERTEERRGRGEKAGIFTFKTNFKHLSFTK